MLDSVLDDLPPVDQHQFRACPPPLVVVAAGAWLGSLVHGLPLAPRRVPLYWFRPADHRSDEFTLNRFPVFIWQRSDGECCGDTAQTKTSGSRSEPKTPASSPAGWH